MQGTLSTNVQHSGYSQRATAHISTRTFAGTCINWWHTLASYDCLTFKPPLLTTFRQMHQAYEDVESFFLNPMVPVSLVNRMVNRKHHGKGVGPNCCKLCHLGTEMN